MAVQFCSFGSSTDAACLLFLSGANSESLHCHLPVVLNWATAPAGAIAEDAQAQVLPGPSVSADTLHFVWLIVVTVGGGLYLLKEDTAANTLATLTAASVTADYAIWGRIIDGRIESYDQ